MTKFKKRTIILYVLVVALAINAIFQHIYVRKQIGKILDSLAQTIEETTNMIGKAFIQPNFNKMKLATVQLKVGKGGGAGIIIKQDKEYLYVLSAQHIFKSKGEIEIWFFNKNNHFVKVKNISREHVYVDNKVDLVLIKVPKPEGEFYSLSLATNIPKIGDQIYTIGHPVKTYYTITPGYVSNYTEKSWQSLKNEYMLISAPSFSGNSGGAVLNKYTEVVGIVVGIFYYEKGILFSEKEFLPHMTYTVKLTDIKRFLEEIKWNT